MLEYTHIYVVPISTIGIFVLHVSQLQTSQTSIWCNYPAKQADQCVRVSMMFFLALTARKL